jgi:hypothetical protein
LQLFYFIKAVEIYQSQYGSSREHFLMRSLEVINIFFEIMNGMDAVTQKPEVSI